jgi:hypothetical protein
MLNVAIAVDSATDYGPETVQAIVVACEEVIGEHRCPAATELGPGMVTAWYAIVHPNDPVFGSVRIEFRDRTADGTLIDERSLTFPRGTSQQNRLASIGSVIAALAAAREGGPIPPRPRAKLPEPSPPPAEAAGAPQSRPPDWNVGIGALAVPSLSSGPYRLGAFGSAGFGFGGRPFALLSTRYAVHPGNPELSWWTLAAGVGARLLDRASPFNVELTGEFVLEHTSVAAQLDAAREGAAKLGWGGRVGASAVWAAWGRVSLVCGVDGSLILPRVHVAIEGQDVTQVPFINAAFFIGVRFQP